MVKRPAATAASWTEEMPSSEHRAFRDTLMHGEREKVAPEHVDVRGGAALSPKSDREKINKSGNNYLAVWQCLYML